MSRLLFTNLYFVSARFVEVSFKFTKYVNAPQVGAITLLSLEKLY